MKQIIIYKKYLRLVFTSTIATCFICLSAFANTAPDALQSNNLQTGSAETIELAVLSQRELSPDKTPARQRRGNGLNGQHLAATNASSDHALQGNINTIFLLTIITGLLFWMLYPKRHKIGKSNVSLRPADIDQSDSWGVIAACLADGVVSGADAGVIARKLTPFNSHRIEQFRMAYVLESNHKPALLREYLGIVDKADGWLSIVRHVIVRAIESSYMINDLNTGAKRLTSSGRFFLEQCIDNGYRRVDWQQIELRLHERLRANCPHCQTVNHTYWFWLQFECTECRSAVFLDDCNTIQIEPAQWRSSRLPQTPTVTSRDYNDVDLLLLVPNRQNSSRGPSVSEHLTASRRFNQSEKLKRVISSKTATNQQRYIKRQDRYESKAKVESGNT